MNAQEFRIGNFITTTGEFGSWSEERTVHASDFSKTAAGTPLCESFDPIPLTEQWLVRLGFVKATNGNKSFHLWGYYIEENNFFIDGPDECIASVKHVHQLQNLYFALTGEELTVKG